MRVFLTHTPDALARYYGERALTELRSISDVRLNGTGNVLDAAELAELAAGCELIIADRNTPAPPTVFDSLPDLVALIRCAVDIRNIDVDAASANGVLVTNASPGFTDAVCELIVGMMIDLARGITACATAYHNGTEAEPVTGVQLSGSRLGILGYGTIGRRLAEIALALGMNVAVSDPYANVADERIRQCSMPQLLQTSDFVACLVIANDETENLFDAAAFGMMKTSAFFINASRGNLVDDDALAAALASGQLAGAALDVGRAPDQMPAPEIARLPNVIATPHIGGLTRQAIESQSLETVDQVRALAAGQLPHNSVNANRATRLERLGIAIADRTTV